MVLDGTHRVRARVSAPLTSLMVATLALFASQTATAEAPQTPGASSNTKAPVKEKSTTKPNKRSPAGKKVISLDDDEFEIFGKLEKPSAFYVLQRSSLEHDWARVDIRLTPLVLESVQDPLF